MLNEKDYDGMFMITTWSLHGDLNIMIFTAGASPHLPLLREILCTFRLLLSICVFRFSRKLMEHDTSLSSSFIIFRFTFFIRMHSKDCYKQRTLGSLVSKDCKQFHQLHKTSLPIHEAALHCWMRN